MPVSDVLKSFRQGGYSEKEEPKKESSSPRMIKLTDDEVKELQGYQKGPGEEQECLVSGRLNGTDFTVTSVHSPQGQGNSDQDSMASELMAKMGNAPVMRSQTMPSPS